MGIEIVNLRRLQRITGPSGVGPGVGGVSVRQALEDAPTAEFFMRAERDEIAAHLPGLNDRMGIFDDEGGGPANWGLDGYMSAVHRLGPDHVFDFPPAVWTAQNTRTDRELVNATDARYQAGVVAALKMVLRGDVTIRANGDIELTGSGRLALPTPITITNPHVDISGARLSIPVASSVVIPATWRFALIATLRTTGGTRGVRTFRMSNAIRRANDMLFVVADVPGLQALYPGDTDFVLAAFDPGAAGYRTDYRYEVSEDTTEVVTRTSAIDSPCAVGIGTRRRVDARWLTPPTGDFTVSGWATAPASTSIVDARTGTGIARRGFEIITAADRTIQFRCWLNGMRGTAQVAASGISASVWRHIAVVRRGAQIEVWVAGQRRGVRAVNAAWTMDVDGAIEFNVTSNALLADWAAWRRALTAAEIAALPTGRLNLSGMDASAWLDASHPSAQVRLEHPAGPSVFGTHDLPFGGSVPLTEQGRTIEGFGSRQAFQDYSLACWLRLSEPPQEDVDVRLPANDAVLPVNASAVVGRQRSLTLTDPFTGFYFLGAGHLYRTDDLTTAPTDLGLMPSGFGTGGTPALSEYQGKLYAVGPGASLWEVNTTTPSASRNLGNIQVGGVTLGIDSMASNADDTRLYGFSRTGQQVINIRVGNPPGSGFSTALDSSVGVPAGAFHVGGDFYVIGHSGGQQRIYRWAGTTTLVGTITPPTTGPTVSQGATVGPDGTIYIVFGAAAGSTLYALRTPLSSGGPFLLGSSLSLPVAAGDVRNVAHFVSDTRRTALDMDVLGGTSVSGGWQGRQLTVTSNDRVLLHLRRNAATTFGTAREQVLLVNTLAGVVRATFPLRVSDATFNSGNLSLQWDNVRGLYQRVTLQYRAGWSLVLVPWNYRDYNPGTYIWQTRRTDPFTIYRRGAPDLYPSIVVQGRQQGRTADVDLISGHLPVGVEHTVKYRLRARATFTAGFFVGGLPGIEIDTDDPLWITGTQMVRLEDFFIGQTGGGLMGLDIAGAINWPSSFVGNLTMLIRAGSDGQIFAANIGPRTRPDQILQGASAGVYDALIGPARRGVELQIALVDRSAAGVDTTNWTLRAMEGLTIRAAVRGARPSDGLVTVDTPWPSDGDWHLLHFSLLAGTTSVGVDGAERSVSSRADGDLFGELSAPISSTSALRGVSADHTTIAGGALAGISGQMFVNNGTVPFHGATLNFYIGRLVMAYTATAGRYQVAVELSRTPGGVRTTVSDQEAQGLLVVLRIVRDGIVYFSSFTLASSDRTTHTGRPYLDSVGSPGTGFVNDSPPDSVDVAIVNPAHSDWVAATRSIRGGGVSMWEQPHDREIVEQSMFDAARTDPSRDTPLRFVARERPTPDGVLATTGTLLTPPGLTGTTSLWDLPITQLAPTTATPALRGGSRGQRRALGGETWLLTDGGQVTDSDGVVREITQIEYHAERGELRLIMPNRLTTTAETNYTLLLRIGTTVHQLHLHARDREGQAPQDRFPGLFWYVWDARGGAPDRDEVFAAVAAGAAFYDRTMTGWNPGPFTGNYDLPVTFPTEYRVVRLKFNLGTAQGVRGPTVQLTLAGPEALDQSVLDNYSIAIRPPNGDESITFRVITLSFPRSTFVTEGLRHVFWALSASRAAAWSQVIRLGGTFDVIIYDRSHADYDADLRFTQERSLSPAVLGGRAVGDATMLTEWDRQFTASEAADYVSLRGIGRVFSGRAAQRTQDPFPGDAVIEAQVPMRGLADDLDDRTITGQFVVGGRDPATGEPVSGGPVTARAALDRLLTMPGARAEVADDVGGGTASIPALPLDTDSIDDDAGSIVVSDLSADLDTVSRCLDLVAHHESLDGAWWVDRSERLRLRRARAVTANTVLDATQDIASYSVTDNWEDLRTRMTVQGGLPSERVRQNQFVGDGFTRVFRITDPITGVVSVSSIIGGIRREVTASTEPGTADEVFIDVPNLRMTVNPDFAAPADGEVLNVIFESNHPIRHTVQRQAAMDAYGVIHRKFEDKSLLTSSEVLTLARELLRRNDTLTHFVGIELLIGEHHWIEPGHGVVFTGSENVDGRVCRLVLETHRELIEEGGAARWRTTMRTVGHAVLDASAVAQNRYGGAMPLTPKAIHRAQHRLVAGARNVPREGGALSVGGAAASPWQVGGDTLVFERVAAWTRGKSSLSFPVDGRLTRTQPHQLSVYGFVQYSGVTLHVRLTVNGEPLDGSEVEITSTEPAAAFVNGLLLPAEVVTLAYEMRTEGAGGARVSLVRVVPGQFSDPR